MIELSIVMPVFNEAATIINAIERVLAVDYPCRVELIVVDDGSTDGTARLLREYGDRGVTVMCHPVNRGKGAAVVTGVRGATGTHVVILDADLEYTPNDIPALLAPVLDGTADHVFGSRVFGLNTRFPSFRFAMGGRATTAAANLLFDSCLTDMHTCLKLVPLEQFRELSLAQQGIRPRHRAHGDDAARGSAPVRGADHLQRADARGGQEDRLARRLGLPANTAHRSDAQGSAPHRRSIRDARVGADADVVAARPSSRRRNGMGSPRCRYLIKPRRRRPNHPRGVWPGRRRIMLIGPGFRFLSGLSVYTCSLANALADAHDVSVVLLDRLIPARLYPGGHRVGQALTSMDYDPRVRRAGTIDWYWGPSARRITRELMADPPDVIVLQWWTAATPAHLPHGGARGGQGRHPGGARIPRGPGHRRGERAVRRRVLPALPASPASPSERGDLPQPSTTQTPSPSCSVGRQSAA